MRTPDDEGVAGQGIVAGSGCEDEIRYLGHYRTLPRRTLIAHGDPEAASSLRMKIEEHLHWDVTVPDYLDQVEL